MADVYFPRCNAESYDSGKKDYVCCLNQDKPCEFREKNLMECRKYREQILPRKHPFILEAVA